MSDRGTKPKNAIQLQIDALLSCAAWNAGAFVWTNNVKDHVLATYYVGYSHCAPKREKDQVAYEKCLADFMVPIFDSELLLRALNGESYNIFTEMRLRITDAEIQKTLSTAEKMID